MLHVPEPQLRRVTAALLELLKYGSLKPEIAAAAREQATAIYKEKSAELLAGIAADQDVVAYQELKQKHADMVLTAEVLEGELAGTDVEKPKTSSKELGEAFAKLLVAHEKRRRALMERIETCRTGARMMESELKESELKARQSVTQRFETGIVLQLSTWRRDEEMAEIRKADELLKPIIDRLRMLQHFQNLHTMRHGIANAIDEALHGPAAS